jgi:hypothetical protein
MELGAQRAFVVAWVLLGVAGAMNHTIADELVGRRFDLVLPHLQYGYVMFNRNPTSVPLYQYAGADGVRHDIADLVATPAIGYKRARVSLDLALNPDYIRELCFRQFRSSGEVTFFRTDYEVNAGTSSPTHTQALRCGAHGLTPL